MNQKIYTCQNCGLENSDEVYFKTDIDNCVDENEMTCEVCYKPKL